MLGDFKAKNNFYVFLQRLHSLSIIIYCNSGLFLYMCLISFDNSFKFCFVILFMYVCVQVPAEATDFGSSGAWVTASCEPPNMSFGNWMQWSYARTVCILTSSQLPFFFFFLRLVSLYSSLALHLLCRPGWPICLCLLSAMIKGVPRHNGSNNSFLNENLLSHLHQYNMNLPNHIIFFSLDFYQKLSNSETEVIWYTLLWVQMLKKGAIS